MDLAWVSRDAEKTDISRLGRWQGTIRHGVCLFLTTEIFYFLNSRDAVKVIDFTNELNELNDLNDLNFPGDRHSPITPI